MKSAFHSGMTIEGDERRGAASFIDAPTLMRIKSLEMRARIVVQGFLSGLHRSPHHGFSVEFSEYRQYSPGDDLRHLDWRLFARSDRYYLKRFEDETNLRCYLLMDLSKSMGFKTAPYTKADYGRTVAATLAYFLSLQRDAVGLVTFDQEIGDYLPARYRPGHLHRLLVCLERAEAGTSTDISRALEQVAMTVRKRGLVILISDLLSPIGSLRSRLSFLRSQGHEVILMRILDPSELAFDFDKPATFVDMETGKDLYIDPHVARAQYQAKFGTHSAEIEKIANDLGVSLHTFSTAQPLELALFDFLQARMHAGRKVMRAGGRGTTGEMGGGDAGDGPGGGG